MRSARSKLAQIGAAVGAAVLLALNVFTINCGFAPTGIGEESELNPAQDAQLGALSRLVRGNAVVLTSSGNPLCIQFDYDLDFAKPETKATQIGCRVFEKAADGVSELKNPARCRQSVAAKSPPSRTFLLECAREGGVPCLGETRQLARLTTATDFVATEDASGGHEGLLVTDSTDPSVTATLHESATFCEGEFSEP